MQPEIAIGTRVRVEIKDRSHYAWGVADRLNGQLGVVEDGKGESSNGRGWLGPALLVRFDRPVKNVTEHLSDYTAFWLPPDDLVIDDSAHQLSLGDMERCR